MDDRIAYYKQQLSNLKVHRKKLCAAIEKTEMESLYAAVKASGKTPKEWLTQFHSEGKKTYKIGLGSFCKKEPSPIHACIPYHLLGNTPQKISSI